MMDIDNDIKRLLFDYLTDTNRLIYATHDDILTNLIDDGGSTITITENSPCGHYHEQHSISILKLIVWMHKRSK